MSFLSDSQRKATTPDIEDGGRTNRMIDRAGNAYAKLSIGASRTLQLEVAGETTIVGSGTLAEGPCDGLSCETDAVYVFAQLREDIPLWSEVVADWTLGDGWTAVGTVITHEGGAGKTADLEITTARCLLGVPYAYKFEVDGGTGGTVTDHLGTAGATARTADGTAHNYINCLVPTVDGKLKFTPSADFDGSIDISKIRVAQHHYLPTGGVEKAVAALRVLGVSLKSAPATLIASPATAIVKAHWYRRPGHVES